MRKLPCILLLFLLAVSCEKDSGQELYCTVTLKAVIQGMEDGPQTSITADKALEGNMFRNINTMQDYNIPEFEEGKAQIRVLKGIYMISFDGDARFADGTSVRVRAAQYNSPENSVRLTEDHCTLSLKLSVLQ